MDVVQWIDTALRVILVGFFALLPGMTVWMTVLSVILLVRRGMATRSRPPQISCHQVDAHDAA